MPTRPATLTGTLTWDDQRPEHPIYNPPGAGAGHPSHPIYNPPGVNVPVFPSHPIWITDAPGSPAHPIVLPDPPPSIWPGRPDNTLPGIPPGIWGGAPAYPDNTLPPYPGYPAHPIWIAGPGRPAHPIYLPPGIGPVPPMDPGGHPAHPIALPVPPDGAGSPTHPIVLPIVPGSIPEGTELYFSPSIGYFVAVKINQDVSVNPLETE